MMLKQMLGRYATVTREEKIHAIREVMQEVALAGLQRGGFFQQAAFYGGTSLRIFYGLPRFSEDLDFSLLKENPDFLLEDYFDAIKTEFTALGLPVTIAQKSKAATTQIESAFLKNDTQIFELSMPDIKVRIKFEVDTQPPLGFSTEEKLLLEPFSFYVKCFELPDLYAGKMHALLFRGWKNRVKGRDWFDFEWYVRRGSELNLAHFNQRALQGGCLKHSVNQQEFLNIIMQKIINLDLEAAKQDVKRFVTDPKALDIWTKNYFMELAKRIRFVQT